MILTYVWPTRMKPSNGTSTDDGEQLCKFILNSIQNCGNYGPDKNLTSKCDLDLGPTWAKVLNGTSTHDGEEFCQIILKSIYNCNSDAHTHTQARTHACIPNCCCDTFCLAHRKQPWQKLSINKNSWNTYNRSQKMGIVPTDYPHLFVEHDLSSFLCLIGYVNGVYSDTQFSD